MQRSFTINLGNIILSLSNAMDLANPELSQHQLRTAFIVWEMGRVANLNQQSLENLFSAAVLHDIGATSVEEMEALHRFEENDAGEHCARGWLLFKSVPWLAKEADTVLHHHRPWTAWDESIENPTAFNSQVILLADHVERWVDRGQYILHQHQKVIQKAREMTGHTIHPQVMELFQEASNREEFWLDLAAPRMYSLLLNRGPYKKADVGLDVVEDTAKLFCNVIDFRSRFTATHSSGVAAAAKLIAQLHGFTRNEVRLMEIAGNLHDIGKMAVPNRILEKPGKLDEAEMAVMKSHTYHSYEVINSINGMQQIAEWAAFHHEKLDGTGYPFHHDRDSLNLGSRIMSVADVFTALAEERPYRESLGKDKVMSILGGMAERDHLDRQFVALVGDNYSQISQQVVTQQAKAGEFYQDEFS
ncbi:MAG: HD domain-containing protein [Desulfarculaceae bacterium]|nr:HD domain-containing protein [Desulfarculaceae bacterium]MCF8046046.1 HD domain-containing protein [Desulfarculaceae bacterium]MCF8098909.1 HD domain-containing protein [Desulfarculaceae bacterium]MCF8121218.1 HD domain-containing protein [Desulfarculaceae bacterium]